LFLCEFVISDHDWPVVTPDFELPVNERVANESSKRFDESSPLNAFVNVIQSYLNDHPDTDTDSIMQSNDIRIFVASNSEGAKRALHQVRVLFSSSAYLLVVLCINNSAALVV
jgi:hypothetical protein